MMCVSTLARAGVTQTSASAQQTRASATGQCCCADCVLNTDALHWRCTSLAPAAVPRAPARTKRSDVRLPSRPISSFTRCMLLAKCC